MSEELSEERRLAFILDATRAATWQWNVDTGALRVNERWASMLGFTMADLGTTTLQTWLDLAHPDDLREIQPNLRAHLAGEASDYDVELRMRHRDGRWMWIHARGRVMTWTDGGKPEWMFGTHIDLTERRMHEEALRKSESFLNRTGVVAGVGGWELDLGGDTLTLSDQVCLIHGMPAGHRPTVDEALGWYKAGVRDALRAALERLVETGEPVDLELPLVPASGAALAVRVVATRELDAQGEPARIIGAFQDVSLLVAQRRAVEQTLGEMSHRARHDALTGLVNRGELESRVSRALENARTDGGDHAVLCIDLDQFKLVNDACGHSVGDQLLQQVSKMLQESVRTSDTVARTGGDEFAILLEHCPLDQAQRIAQKICDRMEVYRFVHEERRFRIGTSIGLASLAGDWPSTEALLQAADAACFAAKEAGRNRVQTWFDSDASLVARGVETKWATRLEDALDNDRFVLHAQRIVPIASAGAATGGGLHAEVLLRLVQPDGTLVSPGAFLPAAERFHLAQRIDRWVLGRAVEALADCVDLARVDTLAVNLSGQSIGDRSFHGHAMLLLESAGPDVCRRLCLEITETTAITNLADAAVFVDRVRRLGVRVALDDFGAGASSFGYLKSLTVDVLKIDGQFVKNLLDNPLDDTTVRCFVDVARVVGVKTVAEMVESDAVLARLREIGVDFAQGYLVHRPEPLGALLRRRPRAGAQPFFAPNFAGSDSNFFLQPAQQK